MLPALGCAKRSVILAYPGGTRNAFSPLKSPCIWGKTILGGQFMKNKLFFAGMAALALTFGFVVMGCGNPLQEGGTVTANPPKVPGVSDIVAKSTPAGVVVIFKAAKNAVNYNTFVQKKDTNALSGDAGDAGSNSTYNLTTGALEPNNDIDKYSFLVSPGKLAKITTPFGAGEYRFGIVAISFDNQHSDIVWSEYITL
jgi:hypothetical protein